MGYFRRGTPSPYLWSYTSAYEKGKFIADRKFDPEAISEEPGVAAMLKALETRGQISLSQTNPVLFFFRSLEHCSEQRMNPQGLTTKKKTGKKRNAR